MKCLKNLLNKLFSINIIIKGGKAYRGKRVIGTVSKTGTVAFDKPFGKNTLMRLLKIERTVIMRYEHYEDVPTLYK